MSIASEITRLQTAKADIKSSIEAKGVTVPSSATLDTYDTYIDSIPSGGGGETPTTLEPVNALLQEHLDYLETIPDTYSSLSDTPTTLYTPNESYKYYSIAKTTTNKFRIYWTAYQLFKSYTSATPLTIGFSYNSGLLYTTTSGGIYRSTSTYTNINNAIASIQSNTTTYENVAGTNIPLNGTAPYYIYNSNAVMVDNDNNVYISQKISSNETIEVISS